MIVIIFTIFLIFSLHSANTLMMTIKATFSITLVIKVIAYNWKGKRSKTLGNEECFCCCHQLLKKQKLF
jgi:hypothetical protein